MMDFSPARECLKARQIGMSQTVAIEHAHKACWQEGYTGIIVSKNLDAALEVIQYAKIAIESAKIMPQGLEVTADNKTSIELSNHSRIKAVAAGKNAGRSIAGSKVTIDEFAVMQFGPDIYQAISPVISTGGDIDVLFSPKGRANMAYLLWTSELGQNFSHHRIHWTENPDFYKPEEKAAVEQALARNEFSVEEIKQGEPYRVYCEWYRKNRPNYTVQQWAEEFECDFLQSGLAVFRDEDIERMFNPELDFEAPIPGEKYTTFWDIGRRHDATVGTTVRIMRNPVTGKIKKRIVKWQRYENLPYPLIAKAIDDTNIAYPGKTYVESNGVGDPVIEYCKTGVEGQPTTHRSKIDMITALQLDLETGLWESPPIPQLRSELMGYVWDDDEIMQDTVMSMAGTAINTQQPKRQFVAATGGQRPGIAIGATIQTPPKSPIQTGNIKSGIYNPANANKRRT